MKYVHISKLDAAKRQLETAIQLFFRSGDPVSIHTLTSAAHGILEDISEKQKITSLKSGFLAAVKPEYRKEMTKKVNESRNFFKHADKDPDGILKFNPESTAFDLWDATMMYEQLTSENVPLFRVFALWNYANDPEVLILNSEQKKGYELLLKGYDPIHKGKFLELVPLYEEALYQFKK